MELHFKYNATLLFKINNTDIIPGINTWIELPKGIEESYNQQQLDKLINGSMMYEIEDGRIVKFNELDKSTQDDIINRSNYRLGGQYVRYYSINYEEGVMIVGLGERLEAAIMESPTSNKWAEKRKQSTEDYMRRERRYDHTLFGGLLGDL